jgi:hypothetical protein
MRQFSDPFSAVDFAWCVVNNRMDLIPKVVIRDCPVYLSFEQAVAVLACSILPEEAAAQIPDKPERETPPEGGILDEYEDWRLSDLRQELEERELSKSGTKIELIERLRRDDGR